MSLRKLPKIEGIQRPSNFKWDAPSDVMDKWSDTPLLSASDDDATITMFDVIGEDWWTGEGVTAKRVSAALRKIGNNEVTVKINSPGGDLFEGIAIYNLLRDHPAKVSIQVMGWAASAASIIAMAGDEIVMGLGSMMMVHNAWGCVCGNRHDMRDTAKIFDGFDDAIVDIYEARTGMSRADISALMDAETFMNPKDSVKNGFADYVDDDIGGEVDSEANSKNRRIIARRQTEAALARSGYTRDQRSELMTEMGVSSAAPRDASRQPPAARDAGIPSADIWRFIETIKQS